MRSGSSSCCTCAGVCFTRGFDPELPMRVTLALHARRD
jgi:hypothetical protein